MARLIIDADRGTHRIRRNLYGHFAEHLGRCIYKGIWVGEESEIPNTRGMRDDVVAALRRLRVPVLRWVGGGGDQRQDGLRRTGGAQRAWRADTEDVALVSIDDVEESAHTTPPLTTVNVPRAEMGTEAVRRLLALLSGETRRPTKTVLYTHLVVRASCRG
jgi:hypothetical protein